MTPRVVLIPGTHGLNQPQDWYSNGSAFVGLLQDTGIVLADSARPFVWTTNTGGLFWDRKHWDWVAGGANLYNYIVPAICPEKCIPPAETRIVCHSHGLQVVLYACAAGLKVQSLISVGGPVRGDMLDVAKRARPNIRYWLHLHADGDFWQAAGELFDGHLGIRREHPLADRNDALPKEAGHAGILRDRSYFSLWRSHGWLAWLRRT